MTRWLFTMLVSAAGLISCASPPRATGPAQAVLPALPSGPPPGPSDEKIAEAVAFVRDGLPFPVEIDPFGAIWDAPLETSELKNLKARFLEPLARPAFAGIIAKVSVDAGSLDWSQWTCRIELKDDSNPISITHAGGLYDGKSNTDPDGYKASRTFVLNLLGKIVKRADGRD